MLTVRWKPLFQPEEEEEREGMIEPPVLPEIPAYLVDDCLLLELKAVGVLHPFSNAQLFSYMKLLDIPLGLLIDFHEPVLKNGISRMILPGANQTEESEANEVAFG